MKESDTEVILIAMRKLRTSIEDLREVRFDPDAELDEAEKDNLLIAEQEIDGALTALHSVVEI